jgi:hypothetical protein
MAILKSRRAMPRKCLTPFVVVVVLLSHSCGTDKQLKQDVLPYLNPELPIDQRVDDLVARMTLEEKISQMINQAPAIERLGVPEYNWWSEGLHGVARAGLATVFPQAYRAWCNVGPRSYVSRINRDKAMRQGQNTMSLHVRANDSFIRDSPCGHQT